MKECKWKGDLFLPCDCFKPVVEQNNPGYNPVIRCKACGAIINKKEPKAVIEKCGETFILKDTETGYLWFCVDPVFYTDTYGETSSPSEWADLVIIGSGRWVLAERVKITDEIAKLRPMVLVGNKHTPIVDYQLRTLIRVKKDTGKDSCKYVTEKNLKVSSSQICVLPTVNMLKNKRMKK